MQTQITRFKLCLEEKRFYDAHEVLEELWFPRRFEENVDIQLLKAFINAAVSFELHKRGRKQQSKKVWANYLKYRPLLFTSKTPNLNTFYQLSRYIERLNQNNH